MTNLYERKNDKQFLWILFVVYWPLSAIRAAERIFFEVNMKAIALYGKHGQGKFTLVDDVDYLYLKAWKWFCTRRGYVVKSMTIDNLKQKSVRMHRIIMDAPKQLEVDHRDHNPLNNQRHNLRLCTHSQNKMNTEKLNNTTSKFKGVHWHKPLNRWCSRIKINSKKIHLGYFKNEIDGAKAYNEKAIELFGEFANLNKLEEKCQD